MSEEIDDIPKQFWIDQKWGFANLSKLRRKYPDMWVSIFRKRVIIADKDLGKVEEETKKKIGTDKFPVLYVECGTHIY
ncbi:MAG: DUF5678 domain-containing protein [Candidatus Thermoplasmatota archaeon]